MDILIIDNKTKHLQKIKRLTESNGDNVKIIKCKNIDLINPADFDFIILSGGGKYSVMGNPKKYVKEIELIKNTKTPILGICLGFQLIVRAFSGTLETFNLGNRTQGIIEIHEKREDNIFNGIQNFNVYESHRWRIKKMPENFAILAESQDGVEIIKHKKKMIYGFQFHPEVFSNKTCGKQIFNNLREQLSPKGRELLPLMRIQKLCLYLKNHREKFAKQYFFKLFFILCFILSPNSLLAHNSLDIVINEIAWMGTTASHADEWIELYNNTNQDIDLTNWTLKSADKAPQIELSGVISANGYFLLERTDDTTILDISANQIYTGALNNNGEILELRDNNDNLIDTIDCLEGWFAGDNTTDQTMERNNSAISGNNAENWHTSNIIGGTPKSQNSVIDIEEKKVEEDIILSEIPQEVKEVIEQEIKKAEVVYISGVIINEILPSPEGADAENEWIEIFNTNNFVVDISGYKISDIKGTTKTYIFPENTKIAKYGFLLLPRPETKITLNNTGDGLKLFYPDNKIADEVVFGKAKSNQSYSRNGSEWKYTENLTPNAINVFNSISIDKNDNQQDNKNLATNPATPKNENLASINASSENLASLNSQTKTNVLNQYLTILIAITISILSAISIIFLKKHSEDY